MLYIAHLAEMLLRPAVLRKASANI